MDLRENLRDLRPQNSNERVLALGSLINTMGNGLFSVTSALYFTRIVGLTPAQIGFAFSVSAALALGLTIPIGHLADIYSPKTLSRIITTISAGAMTMYAFTTTYAMFFLTAVIIGITDRGTNAVRGALIARVGGPEGRVRIRAYLRSIVNLGIAIGSLVGGAALAIDDPNVYRGLILVNACSSLASAWLLGKLPDMAPIEHEEKPRRTEALRDTTYVALVGLNSIIAMHFLMLELIVPLWLVRETNAPRWIAAGTYLINTVACTLFSVATARGAEDVRTAGRLQRRGAYWLALGALTYASAALTDNGWIAAIILLVGSAVHVTGELFASSGSFGIGFGLPPDHLQGQYQAVWSLGWGIGGVIGPTLLTTVILGWGIPGWVAIAALFAVAGALAPSFVERALRDPRRTARA